MRGSDDNQVNSNDVVVKRGTLLGLVCEGFSTVLQVNVEDDAGKVHSIPGFNPQTIRLLASIYPAILKNKNKCVDTFGAVHGKEVYYTIDEYGCFGDCIPVDDASPEVIRMYERAKRKK